MIDVWMPPLSRGQALHTQSKRGFLFLLDLGLVKYGVGEVSASARNHRPTYAILGIFFVRSHSYGWKRMGDSPEGAAAAERSQQVV